MPRLPLVLALAATCAACALDHAPRSLLDGYTVETAAGSHSPPPPYVELSVVDRDGQSWMFRGYVPSESRKAEMTVKLETFARTWRDGDGVDLVDSSAFHSDQRFHDLLIACKQHRRAWVWSSAWMPLRTQEFASIAMPDLDGDGCGDLIIDQSPERIALCTSTGRLVARP